MPETITEAIEGVISNWDDTDSCERKRFDQNCDRFLSEGEQISEAAAATERLNASDFAFRINATL